MENLHELESPQSLFQNPLYRGSVGKWQNDYVKTISSEAQLDWDLATVMSTLGYGYAFGNRTLFRQVKRRPWISKIDDQGQVIELPIPPHGRKWMKPKPAAQRLLQLLEQELIDACNSTREIYVLLSGGLDSRIVAGVVRRLLNSGKLKANVKAVTWGLKESRDVALAKEVADQLEFEWIHLGLSEADLTRNVDVSAQYLGATISPIHLHRMQWLINEIPSDAIVLGGSYGDSVGRSEFSRRTVLELAPLKPFNFLGLLARQHVETASQELNQEIKELVSRAGSNPSYVHYEHQQQCHYMRGMIAQTMSVINRNARLYQAFTAPEVYGFVWSLHPAARTDEIYTELLTQIGFGLVSIPWARNNTSLDGKRRDRNRLLASYHDYQNWTKNYIRQQSSEVSLEEYLANFSRLDFLDRGKFSELVAGILSPSAMFKAYGTQPHSVFLWLEALRKLVDSLPNQITALQSTSGSPVMPQQTDSPEFATKSRSSARTFLSSFPWLRQTAGKARRIALRKLSIYKYPIEK